MKLRSLIIFCAVLSFLACSGKKHIAGDAPEQEFQHCTRLLNKKHFEEAVSCFEGIKSRYPGSVTAQEAELRVGDSYFAQKEYLLAAEAFHAFIELYPGSAKTDYATYMAGLSYFKESPKAVDRDQQYLHNALNYFESFLNHYPRSAYRGIATTLYQTTRAKIAKREFYVGRFYFRTREYIAAASRLESLVKNYPESPLAAEALYLATVANIRTEKLEDAKEDYSQLSVNYSSTPWAEKAKRKLLQASEARIKKEKL